jgi:hypothetical protein
VAKSKRQKSQNSTHAFPPNIPKVLVYDVLATLNRGFERVLCDLERLEGLRLFRRRWQREFLKVWRATLEETRAWVSLEVDPPPKGRTGMDPLRPHPSAGRRTIRVRGAGPHQITPAEVPAPKVTQFDESVRNGARAAFQRLHPAKYSRLP